MLHITTNRTADAGADRVAESTLHSCVTASTRHADCSERGTRVRRGGGNSGSIGAYTGAARRAAQRQPRSSSAHSKGGRISGRELQHGSEEANGVGARTEQAESESGAEGRTRGGGSRGRRHDRGRRGDRRARMGSRGGRGRERNGREERVKEKQHSWPSCAEIPWRHVALAAPLALATCTRKSIQDDEADHTFKQDTVARLFSVVSHPHMYAATAGRRLLAALRMLLPSCCVSTHRQTLHCFSVSSRDGGAACRAAGEEMLEDARRAPRQHSRPSCDASAAV